MKLNTTTAELVSIALGKLTNDEINAINDHHVEKQRYNGWTNYATWRVCLEMDLVNIFVNVYDYSTIPDKWNLSRELTDYVEEMINVATNENNNFAYFYAMAFIEQVNFMEIAQHIITECKFNGGE